MGRFYAVSLVELETIHVISVSLEKLYWLRFSVKDEILDYERIHFSSKEAADGVVRGVDDGLAADIEACIHEDSATRSFFEGLKQLEVPSAPQRVHRLDSCRHVDMGDCWKLGSPDIDALSQIDVFHDYLLFFSELGSD